MGKSRTFYGCLYGADVDSSGTVTGKWKRWGEAYPLSIKMGEDVVLVKGRTCLSQGKIIGSKSRPADGSGSLTLFDYTADNVAKAVQGEVTTRAVTQSTLTDVSVVLGGYGEFSEIGTEDLSSVVVKNEAGDTTYVEGTDYDLDPVLGLIAPKTGGSIAEDATVKVSCTGAANTDQRVTIGKNTVFTKQALKGNLKDDFDGSTCKVFLRMVKLVPTNEVVLLSDEATEREQLDFELIPELPEGQTDIGYIDGLPL